ncbi:MAG: nicotinate (nicotinamide) nucleotide adenylyltransferase [Fimbriimonadaceae bacterium]|nr:nicotinate (nicotinamide) nucleotide adenylyltransferase [Fimbriimonadaceae bacterium]
MRRIGLYGGTFDPPHLAHLVVAERAWQTLHLDTVIWIPCGQPALKDAARAPAAARWELLAAALGGRPEFTASRIELDRPGPSFAIETVAALQRESTPAEWWWILGADALRDFPRWRRWPELLTRCRLAVAARPGWSGEDLLEGLPEPIRAAVDTVPLPLLDLSSSNLREDLAAGRSIRYLVPDAVALRIAQLGLYRSA